jgi:hypothetical protein
MLFVLTTVGENLLANFGIPTTLTFKLGTGVNYVPSPSDTGLHGTQIFEGTTFAVDTSAGHPKYPILLLASSPLAAFGEVGLFYAGSLIALGTNEVLLQNTSLVGNLSILCVLSPAGAFPSVFSPVALSTQSGIAFLPAPDVLPNAASILNPNTPNLYGFLGIDMTAMSAGQKWLLVGKPYVGKRLISSASSNVEFTLTTTLAGTPTLGDRYYISVESGLNKGFVRTATLADNTTAAVFSFVMPWPAPFSLNDIVHVYSEQAIIGVGGGGSATLEHDVTVVGTSVGAIDAGFTFLEGLSFTGFVDLISARTIPPVYTAPALSISAIPAPGSYELGELLSPAISENYTVNNGGTFISRALNKNTVFLANTYPHTDVGLSIGLTPTVYQGQVSYGQGPILNDNLGNPSPGGRIPAGVVNSNSLTFTGARAIFYGTPTSTPATSSAVRAVTQALNPVLHPGNNAGVDALGANLIASPTPSFTILISPGATRVCFAYPATSRSVASVRYQELADSEVKGNFVETSVLVEGANGFAPVAYRVFTYIPVEPFSLTNHYKVFI